MGEDIDAMMGGGNKRKPTIVRCCTRDQAPQCVLKSAQGTKIFLPLPLKVQTDTSVTWGNAEQGTVSSIIDAVWADHEGQMQSAIEGAKTILSNGKPGMVLDALDPQSRKFVFAKSGKAVIPAKELSFDGVDFRSFQFGWSLVPLNAKDSESVHKMVKHVQERMLPDGERGVVGYPDVWTLDRVNVERGSMPMMKDSYIDKLTVDYSAAGSRTYVHEKGESIAFLITISFKEASIFLRKDIQDGIYG